MGVINLLSFYVCFLHACLIFPGQIFRYPLQTIGHTFLIIVVQALAIKKPNLGSVSITQNRNSFCKGHRNRPCRPTRDQSLEVDHFRVKLASSHQFRARGDFGSKSPPRRRVRTDLRTGVGED